ncbi:anti-sigma F factor [Chakrabartyella piscis]|uniref:anti-sigma F factor n=1 Tax=Chakrabartyella piscis TaxID=2918914 RepID=UPI0029583D80|nr:anti-sigma F factor [Chakrabartyella piscis]
MKYENECVTYFAAKSQNESLTRVLVTSFLATYDPTVSEITDVKTAVSEAVTNAIIHGYEGQDGMVELFCGYAEETIYIEVADKGKGIGDITRAMEPLYTSKPELERSGMGFTIMEAFMEGIMVVSTPNLGTRVSMYKKLSRE